MLHCRNIHCYVDGDEIIMPATVNLQYLRPEKRKLMESNYQQIEVRSHLNVFEYHKATILPIRKGEGSNLDYGSVIDSEGEYILPSVIPGWASGYYDDYTCTYENKTVVYCGRMIGQWGHFLLETITRLWFFLEYDCPSYEYILIVKENTTPPITENFLDFFRLLGISKRIRLLSTPVQFETVLIPDRSFQYKRFISPQYKHIIDRVVFNSFRYRSINDSTPRIFLSRSSYPKACDTEVGLDYLDHYFIKNGYKILFPENEKLGRLICMINQATCLAAESGTIAHNMLFCVNAQNTIIIERQCSINDAQISIDLVQSLHTTYVDGNIMLHPVSMGGGPFFLYYTSEMSRMTKELSLDQPNTHYTQDEYVYKCLKRYSEIYHATQKSRSCDITQKNIQVFNEAQKESIEIISNIGGGSERFLDYLLRLL